MIEIINKHKNSTKYELFAIENFKKRCEILRKNFPKLKKFPTIFNFIGIFYL